MHFATITYYNCTLIEVTSFDCLTTALPTGDGMTSYYQHAHRYAVPPGQGGPVPPYPGYLPPPQYAPFTQKGGYYPWAYPLYHPLGECLLW